MENWRAKRISGTSATAAPTTAASTAEAASGTPTTHRALRIPSPPLLALPVGWVNPGESRGQTQQTFEGELGLAPLDPTYVLLGPLMQRDGHSPWLPSPARVACSGARRGRSLARRCAPCRYCPTSAPALPPTGARRSIPASPGARTG